MAEGYKKQVMSKLPSIQGLWHERMAVLELPITITHIPAANL